MDIDIDEGEITLSIRAKRREFIDLHAELMNWNSASRDPLFVKFTAALGRITRSD